MNIRVQVLIIEGSLPTLNEYINAERSHYHAAAKMKKKTEKIIHAYILKSKLKPIEHYPINMDYAWFCKNKRTDMTNLRFAAKFIEDALQSAGILRNDGWKEIGNIEDDFFVDKNARIEVTLTEFMDHD